MLEKPDLPDARILDCLRSDFALDAAALEFIPLGADANAWAYCTDTEDGQRYFVKLRKGELHLPGLTVPRFLRDQGITQVIAPHPTQDGRLWAALDDYALMLSPFVVGDSAVNAGMSAALWREFGATLRRIHSLELPPELSAQLPREQWPPPMQLSFVDTLQARIDSGSFRNTHDAALAAFWQTHQSDIASAEQRLGQLRGMIPDSQRKFVLCHADIHRYNMLVGPEDSLTLVDWDEAMLAPIERDLMFLGAGIDGPPDAQQAAWFYTGYGPVAIDPLLIAYYRYDWLMQDINEFAEWILLRDDLGETSQAQALHYCKALFAAGGQADAADQAFQQLTTYTHAARK